MDSALSVIVFAAGLLFGGLIVWVALGATIKRIRAEADQALQSAAAAFESRRASDVAIAVAAAKGPLDVRVAELGAKLDSAERELGEREAAIAELRSTATQLRDELDLASNTVASLTAQVPRIAQLDTALGEATAKLDVNNQQLNALGAENAKLMADLDSANQQVLRLRGELQGATDEITTLRSTGSDLQRALADLRATNAEQTSTLSTQLEGVQAGAQRLSQELSTVQAARQAAQDQLLATTAQFERLQAKTEADAAAAEDKLRMLSEAKDQLSAQFRALAGEILDDKTKKFTELNQQNLAQILDPLKTELGSFKQKVEDVHRIDTEGRVRLEEQVKGLSDLNRTLADQALNLTRALKGDSKVQGDWGEVILERILEVAGLRPGHEYQAQASLTRSEDGDEERVRRVRPDIVLHLPRARQMVVDSKVSLLAYADYVAAVDDYEAARHLKRHLESVRTHIKGLAGKRYTESHGLKTVDFVIAFIPIEPAFMLAVSNDANLIEEALAANVLLVSPSTLLYVVRTIAYLWRQEEQNKNAIEIANRGARLYEKLSDFVKDLESVGKALGSARDTYDAAFSKLYLGKGSALRQAQMLVELGVKASKSLPDRLVELAAAEDATPVTRQLGPVVGEVIEVLENAGAEQKVEIGAGGPVPAGSEARGPLT